MNNLWWRKRSLYCELGNLVNDAANDVASLVIGYRPVTCILASIVDVFGVFDERPAASRQNRF